MEYLEKAERLYKGKKVLILGLGINQGGVGAAKFFAQAGAFVVVTDLKTKSELQTSIDQLSQFPNIEYILGEHRFEDIDQADLIIRNPAIKPQNPYLEYALKQEKKVEMDLGILLEFIDPQKIIGVTGTKGKSTTASLITQVLSRNGVKVQFAGNIGRSMLDCIEKVDAETYLVLELSSFQLQALETHQKSPKWAVITNIYPDHLNYHETMESYIDAKMQIAKYQHGADYLFLNKDNEITSQEIFIKDVKSNVVYFSSSDLPKHIKTELPGEHNLENIACCVAVAKVFNITGDDALKALADFTGVEFRLQLIKEFNGIKIINDSAATNPAAAMEALKSYPQAILIAGGMNKELAYDEFAKAIDEYAKLVFFIEGDATDDIKKFLTDKQKVKGTYNNLEDLVKDCLVEAREGDVILFSPGATSFNFWENEFDRGRKFNHAVNSIIT